MNTFILHEVIAQVLHTTVIKVLSNSLIYQQAQLEWPHFNYFLISFLIHVINVSSTTALARKLKPLEAPFLPANDRWIL